MTESIHPLHILSRSSRLSLASATGFALTLAANLVIGRYLLPEDVGILALVGVWTFYCQLVRPGFLAVAGRDVPHLLGAGQGEDARHVQNVALTGELLFAVIPFAIVCAAGFFYHNRTIRFAFWIAAVAMLVSSVQTTLSSMFYVYRRFDIATQLRLVLSVIAPVGILMSIRRLGIFSPLVMPGLAAACGLLIYGMHRKVIGFRFAWDRKLARYMVVVGIPFSLMTLVSWGYFMSDRPALIAAGVSLAVIGYYSFASNLIRSVAQVFWDFTAVFQPLLWHEIGRQGSVAAVAPQLTRVWVPYTAAACAAASLGQALFGAAVRGVAPRFIPSVPIFEILVFILVFYNASQLPNLVLNSKSVGRQNSTLVLWSGGLVLNLMLLYGLARSGFSIYAIAAASMMVDLAVTIVGYALSHQYLFASAAAAESFYRWQIGLVVVAVGMYFLLQMQSVQYGNGVNIWFTGAVRASIAFAVWSVIGLALWRWWSSLGASRLEMAQDIAAPVAANIK